MDRDYGDEYGRLYRDHWWWRAREAILLRRIEGLNLAEGAEILDVGSGDGLFFPALGRFGRVRGIEVDVDLLDPAGPHRDRISTEPLGHPRYDEAGWSFDLITALDVLEHIEDDRLAVEGVARMLRPGGRLVATVPAFPSLWDRHDEINHHHRRYTAKGLRGLLEGSGLKVVEVGYLFRALFLPKLLVRSLNASGRREIPQHGIPPAPVNALARLACDCEDRVLGRLPIPFGTSVLAIARRPSTG